MRHGRIELPSPAWQASVLPLYQCRKQVGLEGIEPSSRSYQDHILPLNDSPKVERRGVEPSLIPVNKTGPNATGLVYAQGG